MVKCRCIDDAFRPPEIPRSHWVEMGKEYHVVMIYKMVQPGAMMGVILKEIDLDELDGPWECFRIQRFGFEEEDLHELQALIEACDGLQDFDPLELIEEEVMISPKEPDYIENDKIAL